MTLIRGYKIRLPNNCKLGLDKFLNLSYTARIACYTKVLYAPRFPDQHSLAQKTKGTGADQGGQGREIVKHGNPGAVGRMAGFAIKREIGRRRPKRIETPVEN